MKQLLIISFLCAAGGLSIMGQAMQPPPAAHIEFKAHKPVRRPPPVIEQRADRWVARLSDGIEIEKPRADRFDTALTSSWQKRGDRFLYSLEIDNRQVECIYLGRPREALTMFLDDAQTAPDGWMGVNGMWMPLDFNPIQMKAPNASRGERARYGIESAMLPGPVGVYLQDAHAFEPVELPRDLRQDEIDAVAEMSGYQNNSVRFLIIGPAIPRDADEHELRNRVTFWAGELGLSFLQPLANAGITREALDALQPSSAYEREVVACLRAAVAHLRR